MSITIIITFCVLLLFAYVFDLTAAHTKIPSVILLLLLGWTVKLLTTYVDVSLPDFSTFLPVLGSLGLILIVLEGSLELRLDKTKYGLIVSSFFGALLPILILAFLFAYLFNHFGHFGFRDSLLNAIPLSVISSSIAIPSVRNLASQEKEFVIYESSLSDILGVLIFNFLAFNEVINGQSVGVFTIQLVVILVVSIVAILGLSYLLNNIEHHIKFIPIILMVILIYETAKYYHLPALIFILLFGLFLGNLSGLKHLKVIQRFRPDGLLEEIEKFKELTIEGAFLIRALFFLLFGFLIETSEVLNTQTLSWALLIVVAIVAIRAVQLLLSGLPLRPLLFIAPRGLISILLFLSIGSTQSISFVNNSLIIQVILLTAVFMMLGLLTSDSAEEAEEAEPDVTGSPNKEEARGTAKPALDSGGSS